MKNPPHFINMFGRCRRVPMLLSSSKWEQGRAQRQLIGSLIQGTAAQLTKRSLVRIHKWEKRNRAGIKQCTTVHDELQIDIPRAVEREAVPEIKRLMEDFPQFYPVPILTGVERSETNWSEKEKAA